MHTAWKESESLVKSFKPPFFNINRSQNYFHLPSKLVHGVML